jgi:hypothetical protein
VDGAGSVGWYEQITWAVGGRGDLLRLHSGQALHPVKDARTRGREIRAAQLSRRVYVRNAFSISASFRSYETYR